MNLYYQYIEILKEKEKKGFQNNDVIHKHHIEPKHAGGDPKGPIVLCTARNHARAHYIRYLVYKEKYDLCQGGFAPPAVRRLLWISK